MTAAEAGILDRTIKILSRWTLDCYQRYIHISLGSLHAVPGTMASVQNIIILGSHIK